MLLDLRLHTQEGGELFYLEKVGFKKLCETKLEFKVFSKTFRAENKK